MYGPEEFTKPPEKKISLGTAGVYDREDDSQAGELSSSTLTGTTYKRTSSNPSSARSPLKGALRVTYERGTYAFFRRFCSVLIGIVFAVLAGLFRDGIIPQPDLSSTSNIPLWKWFVFVSVGVFAIPFSRLIVFLTELFLYFAKPQWTTSALYYVKLNRGKLTSVLVTLMWVVDWYTVIFANPTSVTPALTYGTQTFWFLFITAILILLSGFAREYAASYFERTTYWTLMELTLRREIFLWSCCPRPQPVPDMVVMTFWNAGADAVRADPKAVSQTSRYIRNEFVMACSNAGTFEHPIPRTNAVIELDSKEVLSDFAELIFDNVLDTLILKSAERNATAAAADFKEPIKPPPPPAPPATTRSLLSRTTEPEASPGQDTRTRMKLIGQQRMLRQNGASGVFQKTFPEKSIEKPIEKSITSSAVKNHPKLDFTPPSKIPPASPLDNIDEDVSKQVPSLLALRTGIKRRGAIKKQDFIDYFYLPTEKACGINPAEVWSVVFDPHGNRDMVTFRKFRSNLNRFHQERLGLGHTLHDAAAAVERLGEVFYGVAAIIAIVACVLLYSGPQAYDAWIGLTGFFVSLAVVFGSTLTTIVHNLIYLFLLHPFDVGDLLLYEGNFYTVRRLELFSSVFVAWNGLWTQIENTVLSKTKLQNLSRSGLYWEVIEAYVDVGTATPSFMMAIRQHMDTYLHANPESFSGNFQLIARHLDKPLHMKVMGFIEFSFTPQNLTRLYDEIGRLNEAFAEGLRICGATASGVGLGALRANGATRPDPLPFFIPASGLSLVGNRMMSEAIGL